jgi:hypothetical protein
MVAVKGIYQGGDTVKLDSLSVQFAEPYEVVVAFLNPIQNIDKTEAMNKRRQRHLIVLCGSVELYPLILIIKRN